MAFHITQCPGCDSTFNTNARILQLAQGKVRCGACLTVFEAAEHFISINDTDYDEDASVFVGNNPIDYFNPSQFITRSALTAPDPISDPIFATEPETESETESEPESGFDSLLDTKMVELVAIRDDERGLILPDGPTTEYASTPDAFRSTDSDVVAIALDHGSDEADFHDAVAAELDSQFDDAPHMEELPDLVVEHLAEVPGVAIETLEEFELPDSQPEFSITDASNVEFVEAPTETLQQDISLPGKLSPVAERFEGVDSEVETQSEQPAAEVWADALLKFSPPEDFQIDESPSESAPTETETGNERPALVTAEVLPEELSPSEDFQIVEATSDSAHLETVAGSEQPAQGAVEALLEEFTSLENLPIAESPSDPEQIASVLSGELTTELPAEFAAELSAVLPAELPAGLPAVLPAVLRAGLPTEPLAEELPGEFSPSDEYKTQEAPLELPQPEADTAVLSALPHPEPSPVISAPLAPEEIRLHASFTLYYSPVSPPESELTEQDLAPIQDSNEAAIANVPVEEQVIPETAALPPIEESAAIPLEISANNELPISAEPAPTQDTQEEATTNVTAEEKVGPESAGLPPIEESAAIPLEISANNELPIAAEPEIASTEAPTATLSSILESEQLETEIVAGAETETASHTATEISASHPPEYETFSAIEILTESGQQTDTEFFNESSTTHEFELIDLDQFDEADIKLGDGLDWEEDEQESLLEDADDATKSPSIAADLQPVASTEPTTPALTIKTSKLAEQPIKAELDDSTESIRARAFRAILEDDDALEALPAESRKAIGRALPPVELISGNERHWGQSIALFFVGVILAAILAAQFLWQRLPIYSRIAEWRPIYEFACQFIACELPVYSEISAIQSDNLVVRSHPTTSNALSVSLSFRNTARFPQPFPVVILSFNSATNAVIALREFAPDEYLDTGLRDLTMMPVMSPLQIELNVMDPGVDAVNYTVAFRRP